MKLRSNSFFIDLILRFYAYKALLVSSIFYCYLLNLAVFSFAIVAFFYNAMFFEIFLIFLNPFLLTIFALFLHYNDPSSNSL